MEMPRDHLLTYLASKIPKHREDCTLVAVDGRDGAGKTVFANDWAAKCRETLPRKVIRISIDDFHNTREARYRRGAGSPEGFFLDSYDYERFRRHVLEPLGPNGSRRYKNRSHDLATDRIVDDEPEAVAEPGSIAIIDGIFLHRPELAGSWDMSIFLHVSAQVCSNRMLVRDGSAPRMVPTDRYFGGQKMYLEGCEPESKADFVVDNSDFAIAILMKPVL